MAMHAEQVKPDRDVGTVRQLYAVAACRAARCSGSGIRWVSTAKVHPRTGARVGSGAPIPLDHGRDPSGLIVLDHSQADGWSARPFDPDADDPGRPRYSVHWSSCSTPALYVQVRAAADPHGLFPPIRRRSSSREGPCALCGSIHDNHYGSPDAGPLCPTCREPVIATWSPQLRAAMHIGESAHRE